MGTVFGILVALLGATYAFLVFRKWDWLKEKLGKLSKTEFLPKKKSYIFYAFLATVAISIGAAYITAIFDDPMKYGDDMGTMINQNIYYQIFISAILPLGAIAYFTFINPDRVAGLKIGVFYVLSTLLMFAALVAVIMMIYIAIILVVLYFILAVALSSLTGSSGGNRITLEDGTVLKKSSGIFGDSYKDSSGNSYSKNSSVFGSDTFSRD